MEQISIKEAITIYLEDVEVRQCKSKDTVKTYRTTLRRFEKMMDESNVTWLKGVCHERFEHTYI
ncbi:hypothetical protein ACW7EJ_17870, partial [Acinetobacter soli]